jgi:atypical dual specificity phosphatase
VNAPTWIDPGRLLAGRHPCAWSGGEAEREVHALLAQGVTLFVDLTQEGELDAYDAHVTAPVRWLRIPIRDFSVPAVETVRHALAAIDAELESGGVVYLHCWAGCGRTGVIVGCWLVRHGATPREALARVSEALGLGCPQTLEQKLAILGWKERG